MGAKTARVIRNGEEVEIAVDEVEIGDIVFVRPGESIPVDGEVTDGYSVGGKIILLEHVRSDNPLLGKIMDLLDPLTVKMMGPHINRKTVENVKAAGLHIIEIVDQKPTILKLILASP